VIDQNLLQNLAEILQKNYSGNKKAFLEDIQAFLNSNDTEISRKPINRKTNIDSEIIISLSKLNKYYQKGSEKIHVLKDLDL
jgi:hypothetical protein